MFNSNLSIRNLLSDPQLQNLNSLNFEEDCKKEDGSYPTLDEKGKAAYLGPQLWDKTLDYDEFNLEYMDLDEFLAENGFPASSNGEDGANEGSESFFDNSDNSKSPEAIEVGIDFSISPQDLALASIPGREIFDPRKRKFSIDELKPQPMIKKSKKSYVPAEMKDEKYWNRRLKNNFAAKRSRDARRVKENQIAMRAAYLEQENEALRKSLSEAQLENNELRERLNMVTKLDSV